MGGRGSSALHQSASAKNIKRRAHNLAEKSSIGRGEQRFARSQQNFNQRQATDKAHLAATETWWNSLSGYQQMAFHSYTDTGHDDMNSALRGGKKLTAGDKKLATALESSFNEHSKLESGLIMWRGAALPKGSDLGKTLLTKGAELTDKGFTSVTHSRNTATDFATPWNEKAQTGYLIRIKMPKGTPLA